MGWCRGRRCKEVRIGIIYENVLKDNVCTVWDILARNSQSQSNSSTFFLFFLSLSFPLSLYLSHTFFLSLSCPLFLILSLSCLLSLYIHASHSLSLSLIHSFSIFLILNFYRSLWFHLYRFYSCTHICLPDWRAIIRRERQSCSEHTRKNIFPKFLLCWYVHCFAVTSCIVLEVMTIICIEKIFGACTVRNILYRVSFLMNNSMLTFCTNCYQRS